MSNISNLMEKLNLSISEQDFEIILKHPNYLTGNFYLKQLNNAYAQLGKYVVDTVSAIYLYNNFKTFTVGQMSIGITTFVDYIENYFYEDYNLADIVVNPSDANEKRSYVIYKIAGFIYKKFGFIKVYEIFLPYLKKFNPLENKDYKSTLQEYAQQYIKNFPVYEILSTEGLAHEKIYNIQVKVGNKFAVGSAIGKKRATVEAAKNFIEKYKIDYQSHALRGKVFQKQNFSTKNPLSLERKKSLNIALSKLGIKDSAMTYFQMDEIFTHCSYLTERKNENKKSNEYLAILGANVLSMLCCEYIIENYNLENITIAKTQGVLVDEENLSKILPNSITDYFLTSYGHKKGINEVSNGRIKVGIFKSILAAIWLNYLSTKDNKILNCAKKFAERAFKSSMEEKWLDYTSFIQEIAQKFSFSREEKFFEFSKSTNNMSTWKASLKITGANFEINSESYGHNKSSARNLAAKEMLPLLFKYCSNDSETKEQFSRMMNPEELYLFEMQKNNQTEKIFDADEKIHKNVLNPKVVKEISFDNAENVLYIRKGLVFCNKHNHKIFSVTGILATLSGNTVKLNVNYCSDCKIFFIDYSEFKYYRDIYGILLGNYLIQENFNSVSENYEKLSTESVLRICGYTVNQEDNLTAVQRHLILGNLMDKEIISKPRIIRYLQFFINNSKYRDNMKIANKKWQEDLIWVREYKIDTQKHFFISSIEKF